MFPPLENAMLYCLILSVVSEFSAAQEKLAVWLVVVVGITAGMDFLRPALVILRFSCLFFSSGERWLKHLPEPLLPNEPEKQ